MCKNVAVEGRASIVSGVISYPSLEPRLLGRGYGSQGGRQLSPDWVYVTWTSGCTTHVADGSSVLPPILSSLSV